MSAWDMAVWYLVFGGFAFAIAAIVLPFMLGLAIMLWLIVILIEHLRLRGEIDNHDKD